MFSFGERFSMGFGTSGPKYQKDLKKKKISTHTEGPEKVDKEHGVIFLHGFWHSWAKSSIEVKMDEQMETP